MEKKIKLPSDDLLELSKTDDKKPDKQMRETQKHIEFDTWQREIIETKGHILLCTGRQVGKTLVFAAKSAERMIKQKECKIIVASLTEDQAQLMIIMVLNYLERHYKKLIAKGNKKPTKNKIELINGSSIIARPVGNTGDALRGFTGDVLILDENSRMNDFIMMAAKPTLASTGGDLWICSTPHGKQGFFFECFQNKADRFKVFHVNTEDVYRNREISESWTEERKAGAMRFLEEEKATMSELQYAQEYLGQFLDELRQYFSDQWIHDVTSEEQRQGILQNRSYYLGVDIARLGRDDTVFAIVEKSQSGHIYQVYNEIARKWLTTMTEDRIYDLLKMYNEVKKVYIDAGAGSLGVGIFDHLLRDDRTKRIIEAINNRKLVLDRDGKSKQRMMKEDLYDNMRSLGEKGKLHLLNNDEIRLSLKSVQYEYVMKQGQPSQMRIFGDYTHIAEALVRACVCSQEKNINKLIMSFKI